MLRVLGIGRGGSTDTTSPSKQPIYPDTTRNRVGRYLAGGLFPASYNPQALTARGEAEYRSTLPPLKRVFYDAKQNRDSFRKALVEVGYPEYGQKLPAPVSQALIVRAKRQASYVRAGVKTGTGHYQHDAFKADIDTLVRLGKLTAAQGSRAHAWAGHRVRGRH